MTVGTESENTATPNPDAAGGCRVHVRYFAGARAAAGVAEERLSLPSGSTAEDAVRAVATRHGDRITRILEAASFLLDGVAVRDRSVGLPAEVQLDVLPPFAGG
jgi:sulfur-carrier protein